LVGVAFGTVKDIVERNPNDDVVEVGDEWGGGEREYYDWDSIINLFETNTTLFSSDLAQSFGGTSSEGWDVNS
jgi:hypothetical protein